MERLMKITWVGVLIAVITVVNVIDLVGAKKNKAKDAREEEVQALQGDIENGVAPSFIMPRLMDLLHQVSRTRNCPECQTKKGCWGSGGKCQKTTTHCNGTRIDIGCPGDDCDCCILYSNISLATGRCRIRRSCRRLGGRCMADCDECNSDDSIKIYSGCKGNCYCCAPRILLPTPSLTTLSSSIILHLTTSEASYITDVFGPRPSSSSHRYIHSAPSFPSSPSSPSFPSSPSTPSSPYCHYLISGVIIPSYPSSSSSSSIHYFPTPSITGPWTLTTFSPTPSFSSSVRIGSSSSSSSTANPPTTAPATTTPKPDPIKSSSFVPTIAVDISSSGSSSSWSSIPGKTTTPKPITPKPTTPEPKTPEATTPEPTTPEPTTLEPTTPELTTAEPTPQCTTGFFPLGDECFRVIEEEENWAKAEIRCPRIGPHTFLAEPKDSAALAQYMFNNGYSREHHYWMGGRGDGTSIKWRKTHQTIPSSEPWEDGQPSSFSRTVCLDLRIDRVTIPLDLTKPLAVHTCTQAFQHCYICESSLRLGQFGGIITSDFPLITPINETTDSEPL